MSMWCGDSPVKANMPIWVVMCSHAGVPATHGAHAREQYDSRRPWCIDEPLYQGQYKRRLACNSNPVSLKLQHALAKGKRALVLACVGLPHAPGDWTPSLFNSVLSAMRTLVMRSAIIRLQESSRDGTRRPRSQHGHTPENSESHATRAAALAIQ